MEKIKSILLFMSIQTFIKKYKYFFMLNQGGPKLLNNFIVLIFLLHDDLADDLADDHTKQAEL